MIYRILYEELAIKKIVYVHAKRIKQPTAFYLCEGSVENAWT